MIIGVIALVGMVIFVVSPQFTATMQSARPAGQGALPPGANMMIMLFPILLLGFFFVVVPGIWAVFYGSKNVRATRSRDPARAGRTVVLFRFLPAVFGNGFWRGVDACHASHLPPGVPVLWNFLVRPPGDGGLCGPCVALGLGRMVV